MPEVIWPLPGTVVAVAVAVPVAVPVTVAVAVPVAVPVTVAVAVPVAVPVTVAVAVPVAVPVTVAVAVEVSVAVWPDTVVGDVERNAVLTNVAIAIGMANLAIMNRGISSPSVSCEYRYDAINGCRGLAVAGGC
ncbi:MAG: hypothetical protein DWI48_04375 [Chloroflexi bacterium]|nr:MAG: hypothetical protein DWI48_04375 [Chloroflexota bacterium]